MYIAIGVCCLVGVIMAFFAVRRIIETIVFLRASRKASGTVVGHAAARNSDGQATYLPVLEFQTAGDSTVRFTSTVASNPPAYKIGERVGIRYLTKNPQTAKIDSFSEIWMVNVIISLISIICLVLAVLIFVYR